MNILIVDDSALNRKLLRSILEVEGYHTLEASDGIQALTVIAGKKIDLIITDILMPNMDGYKFCLEIRKSSEFSTVPLIFYTSTYTSESDEKFALGIGGDRFIKKPAKAKILLTAIDELLAETKNCMSSSINQPEELLMMRSYNERLIFKLEEKNTELERAKEDLIKRGEELKRSEQKLREIFENIQDVFFRTDLQGTIEMLSPSIARLGYSVEELIGQDANMLFEDPSEGESIYNTLIDKGAVTDFEMRIKHNDGGFIFGSNSCRLLKDQQGNPIGLEGIFRDITERKLTELALALRVRLAALSSDISIALTQPSDIQAVLRQCATAMVVHLDAALARIWTFNSKENVLELQASTGMYTHIDGAHSRIPIGKFKIGLIAQERRPHLTNSLFEDRRIFDQQWVQREGLVAFAGYPLIIEDRLVGVMAMFSREPLAETTLDAMASVAREIAIGIERKIAEQTMRTSEVRFRTYFECGLIGMAITSLDKHYLEVNDELCRILGYQRSELIKIPWDEMTHPADLAADITEFNRMIAGEIAGYTLDKRFIRKDRQIIYTTISMHCLRKADGSVDYFVGLMQDITARKLAEKKIQEQAALLDVARDAIVVRDLNNNILYWNKGAEHIYGWSATEAIGQKVTDLIYTKDLSQFTEAYESVSKNGEWIGELNQITKDKKNLIVEGRWTLVRDNEGTPVSVLAVNTDITAKKKLEAQFLRAQRLENIGTLASGIAHDLNNVLAPILMSTRILSTKIKDERSSQILTILETSAQRGADLVKQVLSFGRGLEGNRTIVQVRHLILELAKLVRETFPKSIEVQTDVSKDLWPLYVDPTQMHQVLMNLSVNARDAMPNGGSLKISATNMVIDEHFSQLNKEAKVGPYIVLSITDNGMGIPPELLNKIFDPFFTTKEIGKGTGLGLSTVIGIIKNMGGFVHVYSELDKGSIFKVYLPAIESAESQQAMAVISQLPMGHGECILVIDDEASVREITRSTLEAFDYKVITAADGTEALALYVRHEAEIKVVLTDMMMPIMDGPATIRALQKLNPQVKIIAASGLASKFHNNLEAVHPGVKAFLSKPFTAEDLLKSLHEVLRS